MKQVRKLVHQVEPHVVDPRTLIVISVGFAAGIFLLGWQSSLLRLDVDGLSIGWVAVVSFGMAWHAGWGSGVRVGGGMMLGAVAALAGFYGSMSLLPATKLGVGMGLGLTAVAMGVLCHVFQRNISFAAAAVGFGAGIAVSRGVPLRPTTPADDLFTLMIAVLLAVLIGALGSLVLRALVVRLGKGLPHGTKLPHFDPGPLLEGVKRTAAKSPNGRKKTVAKAGRSR